jgi:hypothetical protein
MNRHVVPSIVEAGTMLAAVMLFAVAGSAKAQDNPKGEIAGNYTYIHSER